MLKRISKTEALKVIKSEGKGSWTSLSSMNGRGEYGYSIVFKKDGKPVLGLSIGFADPYTVGFDLRGTDVTDPQHLPHIV
jgi:hypothetical protein